MAAHPELVSGERRIDLALMQTGGGDWATKVGAEGCPGDRRAQSRAGHRDQDRRRQCARALSGHRFGAAAARAARRSRIDAAGVVFRAAAAQPARDRHRKDPAGRVALSSRPPDQAAVAPMRRTRSHRRSSPGFAARRRGTAVRAAVADNPRDGELLLPGTVSEAMERMRKAAPGEQRSNEARRLKRILRLYSRAQAEPLLRSKTRPAWQKPGPRLRGWLPDWSRTTIPGRDLR